MLNCNFLDTPIPYQDLASCYMNNPINLPMGGIGGYGNTSYLGGVQMQGQLDADKVQIMNKKESEGKNTFKKALLALAVIGGICFVPSLGKSIKKAGGPISYLKKLFGSKPQKPKKVSKKQRLADNPELKARYESMKAYKKSKGKKKA